MSLVNPQLERIFYGFELDFFAFIENEENVEENMKNPAADELRLSGCLLRVCR